MRVLFLGPSYPQEMQQFTRGLAEVGAEVYGVGDTPVSALPPSLERYLSAYLEVPRLLDEDDVIARCSAWLRGRSIDRVLSNWEPTVVLAARLRERWGIPGMSVDTVEGFRDKQLMKERVAAAGVRVPRSERVVRDHDRRASDARVREAAERVGSPLILKPIAGAGSADTYACRDRAELDAAIAATAHVRELSVEEYIEGEEFTHDTVCVEGEPIYENVAQYLPKPLEARSQQWISPVIITVRDLAQPKIRAGSRLGRQVLDALNMGDGFTHMEWFYTPKGEAVFGEIGCRPGGARLVDQMNYTGDIDLFREWARAACWHAFEASTARKYNCGVIFKRALGNGRITRIEGLESFKRSIGGALVEDQLSRPGTPRRDWKATLVSDGYLMVRHGDWDTCRRICAAAATDIKLYAQ
ncbi:ATP-grasp domain-containing protein [Pseudenhygromyxa sp. WMMC2535]|uniref:ATP-grasp domain-containing protein n=1 Tax=Pseudenhygromyxa sp. WMMC2535 TaxID=2712867 RepID=UPI001551F1D6|nr:ATP-grasp domain-containing protein [Pseudenhygromyxa sp. WMMC2535]NVB42521.1 ATP-grasp domain-containing protein [Pseudenhygromyxa sp. WMMC2535]